MPNPNFPPDVMRNLSAPFTRNAQVVPNPTVSPNNTVLSLFVSQ